MFIILTVLVVLPWLLHLGARARPTSTPGVAVQIGILKPSSVLEESMPSQVPLPPKQDWCPSEIFCAGSLLQTVNIAHIYSDDKVFVDKPTSKPSTEVLVNFQNIIRTADIDDIVSFIDSNFREEGLELESTTLTNLNEDPSFLENVSDPIVKAWARKVHSYWTQLIRTTNTSMLCAANGSSCESTLIPLNHTFVVPGGRFREQYYWDSFWIVEGLIESEHFDIVNSTLQNFMDELEHFGFIPNGGRIYYLNRSQPPLFIQMLSRYVTASGDHSILRRALPLAEKELKWWDDHRTINVVSPYTGQAYTMYRYAVLNSAPRPEAYLTDYLTANRPNAEPPLDESQRAALYAELASAAESGWDFSIRWMTPGTIGNGSLRNLNIRNTIPIDLNSILYKNHIVLASLYESSNAVAATRHRSIAESLRHGIIDLFWDPVKLAFYDFSLTTNSRNNILTAASFYPLWSGIIPDEVLSGQDKAFGFFSSVNLVLNRYNGSFPATFVDSGLQWDFPNSWPPHQYILLQALRALPANVSEGAFPLPSGGQSTFNLIPPGQLGLTETELPQQPIHARHSESNATTSGSAADINRLNGTVWNGGDARGGEGWAHTLERELANRYIANTFCSWLATAGSIPGVIPRLSDAELNVTKTIGNADGNMFEKFSSLEINSGGRGGDYTVQAGFGWTNGVVLWMARRYGKDIAAPQCPDLLDTSPIYNAASSLGRCLAGPAALLMAIPMLQLALLQVIL